MHRCPLVGLPRVTVAQLVEHRTHKPGVAGSIPARDTIRLALTPFALAHGPRPSLPFGVRAILPHARGE